MLNQKRKQQQEKQQLQKGDHTYVHQIKSFGGLPLLKHSLVPELDTDDARSSADRELSTAPARKAVNDIFFTSWRV